MMDYTVFWFILITVLFTGFFFLEGFDYGVGTLTPWLSEREDERSQLLRTITPVWDGNEVWMITAGGALFAAFPHVYATMFSTFYLALFLMLIALILRGVAFEMRVHTVTAARKRPWDGAICFGSAVPAFLWGVAVTDLIAGLPIGENMVYRGGFFDLLTPVSIVGGLAFLFVFAYHGAAFLTLRLHDTGLILRCQSLGLRMATFGTFAFAAWGILLYQASDLFHSPWATMLFVLAALFFVMSGLSFSIAKGKAAFMLSSLAVVFTTVSLFAGLFPRLMVSSLNPAWSLTITNAASTPYTLSIMSVAAVILVPIVLIYQGWCWYIFRHRVKPDDVKH